MSLHVNNRGMKGIRYPAVVRASVARSSRLSCNLPWTVPNCLRRKAWWASRSWRFYAAMRGIVRSTSRNNRLLRVLATNLPQTINQLAARVARQMLPSQVTFDLGRLMASSELQILFTRPK